MPPRLNLLVLRCTDVDATARFYEELDLTFREEQHGSGPRHLAYPGDGWVLELYPLAPGDPAPTVPPRLGLQVDDLPRVLAQVGQGQIDDDGHALVVDPDGRKVDLVEHEHLPLVTARLVLSTEESIDLAFVGPRLGLTTSGVGKAGTATVTTVGRSGRPPRVSFWTHDLGPRRALDLAEVVVELVDELDAVRHLYLTVLDVAGLTATLSVSVRTDDATAVGALDLPLLARLVDLRIALDLNVYVEA